MAKSGDLLPFLAMVLVQIGYAGMNITSKMAMESGMKPLILVAYRQIFATIATFPVAFFLERYKIVLISIHIHMIWSTNDFGILRKKTNYFGHAYMINTISSMKCWVFVVFFLLHYFKNSFLYYCFEF